MKWHCISLSENSHESLSSYSSASLKLPSKKFGSTGPGKKYGHTLNSAKNGRFAYVFGGFGDDRLTNDIHVYDTVNFSWAKPVMYGTVPSPRDFHTCSMLDDKLYVFGGNDGSHSLNDLFVFDTFNNHWQKLEPKGELPLPRENHAATVIGNKIFIFGGSMKALDVVDEVYYNDVFTYDITLNAWSKVFAHGNLPAARDFHTCDSFYKNLVIFGGGDCCNFYLNDLHVLNTETMEWSEKTLFGDFIEPRGGHFSFIFESILFILGGFTNGRKHLDELFAINISSGHCFKQKMNDSIPSPRFCFSGDVLNAKTSSVLIHGGCNSGLETMADVFFLYSGDEEEAAETQTEEQSIQPMQQPKAEANPFAIVPKPDEPKEPIPAPTFSGRNSESVQRFLTNMEKKLAFEKVSPELWAWHGSCALRDKASGWFYQNLVAGKMAMNCSWDSFASRLSEEFVLEDAGVLTQLQLRDELSELRQGEKSVEEYNLSFRELMERVESMDVVDRIAAYTRGLSGEIKSSVRSCVPKTVEEAMDHASRIESLETRVGKRKAVEQATEAVEDGGAKAKAADYERALVVDLDDGVNAKKQAK